MTRAIPSPFKRERLSSGPSHRSAPAARDMPTRRYTVVLVSEGHHVIAHLTELSILTVGANRTEALANVRKRALATMSEYKDPSWVPMPDQKTLAAIELPLPPTSQPRRRLGCHLRTLADADVECV